MDKKNIFRGTGLVVAALLMECVGAQTFTRSTQVLTNQDARSGGCVGIVDMDGDGRDDLVLLHQSRFLQVDYQGATGAFTQYQYGTLSTASQWGFAVGDTDHDGHKDVVSGGYYDQVRFVSIDQRGVYALSTLDNGSMYMQCMNMADINNDGRLDAFGCHDDAAPRIWLNNGTGTLQFNSYIDFTTTPTSDMSGNYGSTWTDFDNDGDLDLYITKCRQGVSNSADVRRWNRLFVNDGNNNFSDQALAYGLQNRNQSWSSDFADIDNDGDLDLVTTNHNTTMQLFLNDGTGHYTEASTGSGLAVAGNFRQSKFEDLDNDGFVDLLCTSGDFYFHNNGNGTFTKITQPFPRPSTSHTLHSFALGDLNHDGAIDVYASYGTGYVTPSNTLRDELYLNNGNANHFLNFNLRGVQSNRDGVGARVTLYGPWGRQVREVRAGESYGIVCSFTTHFGLGTAVKADSAVVRWPSGMVDRLYEVAADQWVELVEGATRDAKVAVKVLLDGPYVAADGLMGDGVRAAGLLPLSEPYTALGSTIVGWGAARRVAPSVFSVTGANAIVDWVWLELRSAAVPATVLRARPALLQRDGDVVELDGKSPVAMGAITGAGHVVVRHRNHLGCMTAASWALGATVQNVDLTLPTTSTWGTNARKAVSGRTTLWPGDVHRDKKILYLGPGNDRDPILTAVGGSDPVVQQLGYFVEDVNLDGAVRYLGQGNDRDPVLVTIGGSTPTLIRIEQIPGP